LKTKFIPLCEGISGTIAGALAIDLTYQDDEVDIPIDALVLDLTRKAVEGDDSVDSSLAFRNHHFFSLPARFFRLVWS
jgi:hypothetical protein